MSDIFLKKDTLNLLEKKHIVFFGDSSKFKLFLSMLPVIIKTRLCVCHVCMHVWYVCLQVCLYMQGCWGEGNVEITLCIIRATDSIIK
jgi:hypothetical protein